MVGKHLERMMFLVKCGYIKVDTVGHHRMTGKEHKINGSDYWLYGIENGIMNEPMVDVQRENKTWKKLKNWPDPAAVPSKVRM